MKTIARCWIGPYLFTKKRTMMGGILEINIVVTVNIVRESTSKSFSNIANILFTAGQKN